MILIAFSKNRKECFFEGRFCRAFDGINLLGNVSSMVLKSYESKKLQKKCGIAISTIGSYLQLLKEHMGKFS